VLPGYTAFRYFDALFRRYGIDPETNVSLLDWGCGVGRLAAHFLRGWPKASVYGTDIDAGNVEWCRSTFAGGRFDVAPLWPPTSYRTGQFDALFGVSVMTHLTEPAQAAWLAELARIVRPGGIALVTFSGTAGTSYGSRWRSQAWWDAWQDRGFDAETRDAVLDGYIEDGDYYRQTSQTVANVEATWSVDFEIVEIVCAAFGNQDLAVLRRR
jgi:SAM-dependent methyltransferase